MRIEEGQFISEGIRPPEAFDPDFTYGEWCSFTEDYSELRKKLLKSMKRQIPRKYRAKVRWIIKTPATPPEGDGLGADYTGRGTIGWKYSLYHSEKK